MHKSPHQHSFFVKVPLPVFCGFKERQHLLQSLSVTAAVKAFFVIDFPVYYGDSFRV